MQNVGFLMLRLKFASFIIVLEEYDCMVHTIKIIQMYMFSVAIQCIGKEKIGAAFISLTSRGQNINVFFFYKRNDLAFQRKDILT